MLFSLKTFLGALSGALIGGAGMVINDYFDVEIDKINRPDRPIPSNRISLIAALRYYFALNLIALILLLSTNILALLVAIVSIVVIYLYSYKLKNEGLIGNFSVGLMTGIAFIFGGIIGNNIIPLLFPFILALLVNFSREVLKDIEDIEGDSEKNLKTFPIVYGKERAIKVFVTLVILTIISSLIPFLVGIYNVYYLIIVLVGVDLGLIYSIKKVLTDCSQNNLKKISNLIKYEMLIGLLAIYIGME